MASEVELPERLRWTLDWQTENLMPLLRQEGADGRLLDYWRATRHMDDVLDRVRPDSDSLILDVGGGLTTPLRWLPGQRICLDPLADRYAERFALPVPQVTYQVGGGECIPLESGSVDLVVCTNCIDHTSDPHRIVAEFIRVLRPGGWCWFTCEEGPPGRPRNAGHPHAFDQTAIRRLVEGFEIALEWEEPWRGIYRFIRDEPSRGGLELGFLLRTPTGPHG